MAVRWVVSYAFCAEFTNRARASQSAPRATSACGVGQTPRDWREHTCSSVADGARGGHPALERARSIGKALGTGDPIPWALGLRRCARNVT